MNDRTIPSPPERDASAEQQAPCEPSPQQTDPAGELAEGKGIPGVAITGLLVLAIFGALYFARDVLLPVVLAALLTLVLTPVLRVLAMARIPQPVGAGIIVVC